MYVKIGTEAVQFSFLGIFVPNFRCCVFAVHIGNNDEEIKASGLVLDDDVTVHFLLLPLLPCFFYGYPTSAPLCLCEGLLGTGGCGSIHLLADRCNKIYQTADH